MNLPYIQIPLYVFVACFAVIVGAFVYHVLANKWADPRWVGIPVAVAIVTAFLYFLFVMVTAVLG